MIFFWVSVGKNSSLPRHGRMLQTLNRFVTLLGARKLARAQTTNALFCVLEKIRNNLEFVYNCQYLFCRQFGSRVTKSYKFSLIDAADRPFDSSVSQSESPSKMNRFMVLSYMQNVYWSAVLQLAYFPPFCIKKCEEKRNNRGLHASEQSREHSQRLHQNYASADRVHAICLQNCRVTTQCVMRYCKRDYYFSSTYDFRNNSSPMRWVDRP